MTNDEYLNDEFIINNGISSNTESNKFFSRLTLLIDKITNKNNEIFISKINDLQSGVNEIWNKIGKEHDDLLSLKKDMEYYISNFNNHCDDNKIHTNVNEILNIFKKHSNTERKDNLMRYYLMASISSSLVAIGGFLYLLMI